METSPALLYFSMYLPSSHIVCNILFLLFVISPPHVCSRKAGVFLSLFLLCCPFSIWNSTSARWVLNKYLLSE